MLARLWRHAQREVLRRPPGGFPALDGIRAIAVVLVIFFHATSWMELAGESAGPPPAGSIRAYLGTFWIGVDVFFVLSGFLIGRIMLRQLRDGHVRYGAFYLRRAARILPAYYVVLTIAVFVLSRLPTFVPMYGNASLVEVVRQSFKSYAFLSNYLRGGLDVMGWTWSLCVEEHFYLVLPLALAALFRLRPRARLAALALLPLVPLLVRAAVFVHDPMTQLWDHLNWESHTRSDGLLMGVLIAYVHVFHPAALGQLTRRLHVPMLLAAAGCYAMMAHWGGVFGSGVFAIVAQFSVIALGAALVVAASLTADHRVARVLAHPGWYPVARVSYGMYLVHPFLALWLLGALVPSPADVLRSAPQLLAFGTVVAVASFVVASGLFLVVELPMLRWGARVAPSDAPTRPAS